MAKTPEESEIIKTHGLSNLLYYGGVQPRNILSFKNNFDITLYHINMMFEKTNSMFEYGGDFGKGKSEKISKRYLEAVTQTKGYSVIFEVNGKLYCTWGTLGGRPRYDHLPSKLIVNNPYIPFNGQLEVDEDCVFYKNDSFAWGLYPLSLYYATKLCDNDQSRRVLLIITRAMKALYSSDSDTTKAIKEFFKDLETGKLSAIFDNNLPVLEYIKSLDFSTNSSAQTLIQLLEDYQYQKGSWWNEVGVQSNYNMKRETITSSENILNVDSLLPFSDNMLEARKEQVKRVNEMFGVNWTVDFSSAWSKIRKEIKQKEDAIKAEAEQLKNKNSPLNGQKEQSDEDKGEQQ